MSLILLDFYYFDWVFRKDFNAPIWLFVSLHFHHTACFLQVLLFRVHGTIFWHMGFILYGTDKAPTPSFYWFIGMAIRVKKVVYNHIRLNNHLTVEIIKFPSAVGQQLNLKRQTTWIPFRYFDYFLNFYKRIKIIMNLVICNKLAFLSRKHIIFHCVRRIPN